MQNRLGKFGVLFIVSGALIALPQWFARAQTAPPRPEAVEVSVTELNQMVRAREIAQRFLDASVKGDLKAAKALCSAQVDVDAPSSGDAGGDNVIEFGTGAELKASTGKDCRIVDVEYRRVQAKKGPYVIVWMRQANAKPNEHSGVVYKPSVDKIVMTISPAN